MPKSCHETRVDLLFGLACLLGCVSRQQLLAVGSIPDVVAVNVGDTVLFIGDAKYSETPNDINCQTRIYRYLRVAGERLRGSTKFAIFALCYGNAYHASGWREMIVSAAHEFRIPIISCSMDTFPPNSHVMIFVLASEDSP